MLWLCSISISCAQESRQYSNAISIEYFKGFIFQHSSEVAHLVASHPTGIIFQYDKHIYGDERWEYEFRYPDVGYTMIYIDYNNSVLGKTLAPMAHFNYYFNRDRNTKHDFKYKVGFGPAFHTNPYDRESNNKNILLGSVLSFGMQMQLHYNHDITDDIALKGGISLTHFSNASIKQPNKGINLVSANFGLIYQLDSKLDTQIGYKKESYIGRPIKYNLAVSGGYSEALKEGNGVFPFFVISGYADKRISRKSAFSLGLDYFVSYSLREEAKYDVGLRDKPKPDFKRAGIAIGYELYWNDLSFLIQYGHYFYRPYERFKPKYQRLGLKYYLNEKLFVSFMLKTHLQKAEAGEFGIGMRI
ncbi:MAG: acyloxyacyl hydrolase [Cyclobacteriaceae bacterium]|nr:acyloxyacyl hydrolase [Cyclobacteriaceae bacterium]